MTNTDFCPRGHAALFRQLVLAAGVAVLGAVPFYAGASDAPIVPARWQAAYVPGEAGEADVDSAWWRGFGDAELDRLVESALLANRDLHIATARLEQAHALAGAAEAARLPQLEGVAGVRRGRESSADPKTASRDAGFRASWELDLWGGRGMASRAARQDAEVQALSRRALQVSLAAEVATAYFDVRTLQRRAILAQAMIETVSRALAVAERRFEAGQVSRVDIDRLAAERAQQAAASEQLLAQKRVRLYQLAVLLGTAMPPEFAAVQTYTEMAPGLPPLLPAELLERRPDVQAQARALEAAVSRLGVAKRDLYPRFMLDWSGRRERLSIEGGSSAAPVMVIGYGLSVSLPIFDGGRIRANIDLHEARVAEAMAEYEKAMLNALADVEIALGQLAASQRSRKEVALAVDFATQAALRSERFFEAGQIDLNSALDAVRARQRSEDALLQTQGAELNAAVAVHRAFAGGV
ncbi:MAG: TolC family protein [Rhodocyclales bacterium GT-UBC]|nr:MAG: TolC family protein [Rhodocyclales bacterium GT-UBC]